MLLRSLKPIAVGAVIASCSFSVQAKELIFNNFFPPSHFIRGVMSEWAEDVAKATEGRVTFQVPAGSLAAPPQQLSAVKSGIADVAITANIFVQKQVPVLSYSSLPFLTDDAEAASVANWRAYDKFLAAKTPLKRHGVEVLSVFNFSGGHLYGLEDKPIESLDELKSKRLWALPGYSASNISNLGVSPVTGPAVKISEVVAKGVVDAFYGITFESVTDFKASPYTRNIVRFPYGGTSTDFSLFIDYGTDPGYANVRAQMQEQMLDWSSTLRNRVAVTTAEFHDAVGKSLQQGIIPGFWSESEVPEFRKIPTSTGVF